MIIMEFVEIWEFIDLAQMVVANVNSLRKIRPNEQPSVEELVHKLQEAGRSEKEDNKFDKLCIFLQSCHKALLDFRSHYEYDLGGQLYPLFLNVIERKSNVQQFMSSVRRSVESLHDSMFEEESKLFASRNASMLVVATPVPLGWLVGVPIVGVGSSIRWRVRRNQLRVRKKACLEELDKYEKRYIDHLKRSKTI